MKGKPVKENPERSLALKIAWEFLGLPYRWGGDDPINGFDCSGFIVELLQSTGKIPLNSDYTAEGLWRLFMNAGQVQPHAGCLVFWESGGKVSHVEMMIDPERSIGASGGGGATITREEAVKRNAYIKIRLIKERTRTIRGYADPFQ